MLSEKLYLIHQNIEIIRTSIIFVLGDRYRIELDSRFDTPTLKQQQYVHHAPHKNEALRTHEWLALWLPSRRTCTIPQVYRHPSGILAAVHETQNNSRRRSVN